MAIVYKNGKTDLRKINGFLLDFNNIEELENGGANIQWSDTMESFIHFCPCIRGTTPDIRFREAPYYIQVHDVHMYLRNTENKEINLTIRACPFCGYKR